MINCSLHWDRGTSGYHSFFGNLSLLPDILAHEPNNECVYVMEKGDRPSSEKVLPMQNRIRISVAIQVSSIGQKIGVS